MRVTRGGQDEFCLSGKAIMQTIETIGSSSAVRSHRQASTLKFSHVKYGAGEAKLAEIEAAD